MKLMLTIAGILVAGGAIAAAAMAPSRRRPNAPQRNDDDAPPDADTTVEPPPVPPEPTTPKPAKPEPVIATPTQSARSDGAVPNVQDGPIATSTPMPLPEPGSPLLASADEWQASETTVDAATAVSPVHSTSWFDPTSGIRGQDSGFALPGYENLDLDTNVEAGMNAFGNARADSPDESVLSESAQEILDDLLFHLEVAWDSLEMIELRLAEESSYFSQAERRQIQARVKAAVDARREQEKTWPKDSINDRIDEAMADLVRAGVVVLPSVQFNGYDAMVLASPLQRNDDDLDVVYVTGDSLYDTVQGNGSLDLFVARITPTSMADSNEGPAERVISALSRHGVSSRLFAMAVTITESFAWKKRLRTSTYRGAPWQPVVATNTESNGLSARSWRRERARYYADRNRPLEPSPSKYKARSLAELGFPNWYFIAYDRDAFESLDDFQAFYMVHGISFQWLAAVGPANDFWDIDVHEDLLLDPLTPASAKAFSDRFIELGPLDWLQARGGNAHQSSQILGETADHWIFLMEVDDGLGHDDLGL